MSTVKRMQEARDVPVDSLHEHPIAACVPDMRPDEWAEFYADVVFAGIKLPLEVLADGTILDGRHRWRAAKQAGLTTVPVVSPHLNGDSPEAYLLKMAVVRRHLSDSQRACVGAMWADTNRKQAGRPDNAGQRIPALDRHPTRAAAATLVNVSEEKVKDAAHLYAHDPDLFKQVHSGERSLIEAKREAKGRERERHRQEDAKTVATAPQPTALNGVFATIVIDPPWDWGDEGDIDQFGRATPTYKTMPFEEIERLPVADRAATDAHIYLWITNRSLPKGFRLLEAWGFRYVTCLTWCKPSIGMGNYFRGSTEHVLFGIRGSLPLERHNVGTWFTAPRGEMHSAKPDEFYRLVESCSPSPRLEMFGRKQRDGWTVWGNVNS